MASLHTRHFIIGGKLLGSAAIPLPYAQSDRYALTSYAYFCPHCGDTWARCPVEIPAWQQPSQWTVWNCPCKSCKAYSGQVPGSLLFPWDAVYSELVLSAIPHWEFQRHLDHAERLHHVI